MVSTPREIISAHIPSLDGELPIHGGWGFSKEDACIIDKNDPVVSFPWLFDAWGVVGTFIQQRIYEELIISRERGMRHNGISWALVDRATLSESGRTFEWLKYVITSFEDKDWEYLKAEYEGKEGIASPEFDINAHYQLRNDRMSVVIREYWFDVTSCFDMSIFGIPLPWVIGLFARRDVTDYESQTPGQGYSIAYSHLLHDSLQATVYLYTNGEEDIADDVRHDSIIEHFRSVVSDVLHINEQKFNQKCRLITTCELGRIENSPDYLCAEFDVNSETGPKKSFLFLKGHKGQFFKIRLTLPYSDDGSTVANAFAYDFSDILSSC